MLSLDTKLLPLSLCLLLLWSCSSLTLVQSKCKKGCPLALASFWVYPGLNVTGVAQLMNTIDQPILDYNPSVPDKDRLTSLQRINIPFSCDCLNDGQFLGHMFQYTTSKGDTYQNIAEHTYSNLTTFDWIQKFNNFPVNNIPVNSIVNVTVNCSCGSSINKKYGLFLTYPLMINDTLSSITQTTNSTSRLLQMYNPNVNFNSGTGIAFIPAKGIIPIVFSYVVILSSVSFGVDSV